MLDSRTPAPNLAWAAHAADNAWRITGLAMNGRRRLTVRSDTDSTPFSASTRKASALLVGSMILANTRSRNTSSPSSARSNPSAWYA
jgi:hypothetical protein